MVTLECNTHVGFTGRGNGRRTCDRALPQCRCGPERGQDHERENGQKRILPIPEHRFHGIPPRRAVRPSPIEGRLTCYRRESGPKWWTEATTHATTMSYDVC